MEGNNFSREINIPWGNTPNPLSSNPFRYHFVPRGTPLGGSFDLGGSHYLGYTYVPRGSYGQGSSN
jgi:hypothetical protein